MLKDGLRLAELVRLGTRYGLFKGHVILYVTHDMSVIEQNGKIS
jgi:hypothetical protein